MHSGRTVFQPVFHRIRKKRDCRQAWLPVTRVRMGKSVGKSKRTQIISRSNELRPVRLFDLVHVVSLRHGTNITLNQLMLQKIIVCSTKKYELLLMGAIRRKPVGLPALD